MNLTNQMNDASISKNKCKFLFDFKANAFEQREIVKDTFEFDLIDKK